MTDFDGASETYLRVQIVPGEDPLEVQGDLATIGGYIGSYVVETEAIGDGEIFPFDIAIGFNGTPDEVDAAVETVRNDWRVAEVRETRNRSSVPTLILRTDPDAQP
jgi:hypothetical protein